MKKLILLALLIIPVTSFAASSVRVLGANTATSGSAAKPAAKVVPSKNTAVKTTAAKAAAGGTTTATSGASNTSRIGTIRAKTKTPTGTVSGTTSSTATTSGSRFPVITPAHSYNAVTTPQANSNTALPSDVTTIVEALNQKIEIIEQNMEDDPRFDMIRISDGSPEAGWRQKNNALVDKRIGEHYVFMWVEE